MAYLSRVYIEDINDRVKIPPRSRLFGLDPIGVCTPKSEGLISYINRLAKEHSISPRLLISKEFAPHIRDASAVHHREFYSNYAKTLQSTGKYACKFVTMTEQLTGRPGMSLLTTLPWQEIVPSIGTGLMTTHPKWCTACLTEHRANHEHAYFRLSWGYALYQVCSQHRLPLVDECPWCGKFQPFFPNHADISRCNYCYGWLGTVATEKYPSNDQRQLWVSRAIEDIVENGRNAMGQVTGELFRDKLTSLVNTHANGQKTRLAEMLGLTRTTIASWIIKKQKPLFPQLLYLCHQLGMMPSEFLLSNLSLQKVNTTHIPSAEKLHQISPKIGLLEPPKADIYLRLKAIGSDTSDCRSLAEIATDLSLTRTYLTYWFQAECDLISLRHKQSISQVATQSRKAHILSVRSITWHLYSKGIYPSNRRVAKEIAPLKLSFLKPHLRDVHRKTLRELKLFGA